MSTAIEMEDEIEDAVEVEPQRRRFTVEEFQRMGEAGIIAPDERVELIDGEVYEMTPVGPRHIWSVIYPNPAEPEPIRGNGGFGRVPPLRSGPGCARRRQRYNRCERRRAPSAAGHDTTVPCCSGFSALRARIPHAK